MLHELGHALGLKHGHEATGPSARCPADEDSMEFSLMTYRSYVGANPATLHNETWGHAQTYMMNDIAALQALYGADFTTSAGDTTYAWDPDTGVTRVDGAAAIVPRRQPRSSSPSGTAAAHDTYDLSAYATALDVDLAPGGALHPVGGPARLASAAAPAAATPAATSSTPGSTTATRGR